MKGRFMIPTISKLAPAPNDRRVTELGRFLAVAADLLSKGAEAPQMFSGAIDATWHELIRHSDQYDAFCRAHVGRPITHVHGRGRGVVNWVKDYERRFGPLPGIWFTDNDGELCEDQLRHYQHTGQVRAEWDCAPKLPDGDDEVIDAPPGTAP